MNLPACSPDLNPMERVWDMLGRLVRSRVVVPATLNQLCAALQELGNIPQDDIRRLFDAPPTINPVPPKFNPARFKTKITKLIRSRGRHAKTVTTVRTLVPIEEAERLVFLPEVVQSKLPANVNRKGRSRGGKRFRLIQVDQDGKEIPEMVPTPRRRVNNRSVLKCNKVVTTLEQLRDNRRDDKNICVLFTNFTSEGDYINDHDYLINPYIRNKMFYHQGSVPVCICLLCDLIHQAKDHVEHMKSHRTICHVCQVDFHNAFILNLHVRCHSTYCSECRLTVSYAGHYPHAREHNRSVTLSNIDIPKVMEEYLYQPEALPLRKEKEPPPTKKGFITLKELLNEPVHDKVSRSGSFSSSSPSISPRRSRRITRSRKAEIEDPSIDEEEACIYDKATKSFITPSAEKQQKLLQQCTSNKEKTESNKNPKEANIDPGDDDREAVKINESESSDIHKLLLCEESIKDKPDTEILNINTIVATETTIPVQSTDIPKQQNVITKVNPKKYNYKKRRRIFSVKRKNKGKISGVSIEPQGNEEEASEKIPESAISKTIDCSKSDVVPETQTDLVDVTHNSNTTIKDEESDVLQGLDRKNIETSEETQKKSSGKRSTTRKGIERDLNRCNSSTDGKRPANKLTAKIVNIVRSYSRPNRKRKRVGDNPGDVTSLVGDEMEPTPTQSQESDIKDEKLPKDEIIVDHSTSQTDASKTDVGKKPGTPKQRKKTELPVTLSSESSNLIPPPTSLGKTKPGNAASKKSDPTLKKPVAKSALSILATATQSLVKRSVKAARKQSGVSQRRKTSSSNTESAPGTDSESSILAPATTALLKRKSVNAGSKKLVAKQRKTDSSKTESPPPVTSNPPTSKLVKKSVRAGSKKSEDSKQRKPEPSTNSPIIATENTVGNYRVGSPETTTESSQDGEVKSPLRGDLKIKIKSLKYNPFVSLTNLGTQVPDACEDTLKTTSKTMSNACDRTNRKRKRGACDSDPTPLVEEKGTGTADNAETQEALGVSIDVKETANETSNEGMGAGMLRQGDDDKKDLRSNTGTGRKARSSRSRGSLGLVEGLKFPEKRSVSKKTKKSEQDSVDLDTSKLTNMDVTKSSGLEVFQLDGRLEPSQAEGTTPNESSTLVVQLEEPSAANLELSLLENEEPTESSVVDLEPLELKNVETKKTAVIANAGAEN